MHFFIFFGIDLLPFFKSDLFALGCKANKSVTQITIGLRNLSWSLYVLESSVGLTLSLIYQRPSNKSSDRRHQFLLHVHRKLLDPGVLAKIFCAGLMRYTPECYI